MGTGTIRSQTELNEENIVVKNSHARGENSSVDGKHISDFMGKRRVELHRTTYLPLGYLSHGGKLCQWRQSRMGSLEQIGFDLAGQGALDLAQIRSEFPSSNNHSYRPGGLVEKDRINRTLCSRTREPCFKRISATLARLPMLVNVRRTLPGQTSYCFRRAH
jgi:hypothetical protein